jgi:uncharacterized protein (DUF427 family)
MSWLAKLFQGSTRSSGSGAGKTIRAVWNGQVIAESDQTVVVEGNHYFPLESVQQEFLVNSSATSFCFWKGTANYYSLNVNGQSNPDAAWFYDEPKKAAQKIQGRMAFWKGVEITSGDTV